MVPIVCRASIGVVGNGDHNLIKIGKAGRKRHMGIRPTVRALHIQAHVFFRRELQLCDLQMKGKL